MQRIRSWKVIPPIKYKMGTHWPLFSRPVPPSPVLSASLALGISCRLTSSCFRALVVRNLHLENNLKRLDVRIQIMKIQSWSLRGYFEESFEQ